MGSYTGQKRGVELSIRVYSWINTTCHNFLYNNILETRIRKFYIYIHTHTHTHTHIHICIYVYMGVCVYKFWLYIK